MSDERPEDWTLPKARRGRKKGQAVKAHSPDESLKDNALNSLFGEIYREAQHEFLLCYKATYVRSPVFYAELGKYIAQRIQRKDSNFFRRMSSVLASPQFQAFAKTAPDQKGLDAMLRVAPDKLSVVIAAFAEMSDRTGVDLAELVHFVETFHPDAAPEDVQTYRNKCKAMGIPLLRGKRGPRKKPKTQF